MGIIDAHTHVLPQYASLAVRVMDRCHIDWCVTLEWHDGFGERLREHLGAFSRYPGRFVVFGNVDFGRINEESCAIWRVAACRPQCWLPRMAPQA